jgi:ubiquinone/menaquinone biosynthesis C-methylase UbiE
MTAGEAFMGGIVPSFPLSCALRQRLDRGFPRMSTDRNPQAAMMADESMVRTLRYQIQAIWPQEVALFDRYALADGARILDLGCGTGEATCRLAARFPAAAEVVGVDVGPEILAVARREHAALAPRVRFEAGDGFNLAFPAGHFDLVVCRHVTQLLPDPERLLAELVRVLRPGGWLHVLSEDYGMLHFPKRAGLDPDRLWHEVVVPYTDRTGTDARVGRRTLPMLRELGLREARIDYLVIDTERASREALEGIFVAWRDGYAEALAAASGWEPARVRATFDAIVDCVRDPAAYCVWQVPVCAGRKP